MEQGLGVRGYRAYSTCRLVTSHPIGRHDTDFCQLYLSERYAISVPADGIGDAGHTSCYLEQEQPLSWFPWPGVCVLLLVQPGNSEGEDGGKYPNR